MERICFKSLSITVVALHTLSLRSKAMALKTWVCLNLRIYWNNWNWKTKTKHKNSKTSLIRIGMLTLIASPKKSNSSTNLIRGLCRSSTSVSTQKAWKSNTILITLSKTQIFMEYLKSRIPWIYSLKVLSTAQDSFTKTAKSLSQKSKTLNVRKAKTM